MKTVFAAKPIRLVPVEEPPAVPPNTKHKPPPGGGSKTPKEITNKTNMANKANMANMASKVESEAVCCCRIFKAVTAGGSMVGPRWVGLFTPGEGGAAATRERTKKERPE